jgi:hypothetical protein
LFVVKQAGGGGEARGGEARELQEQIEMEVKSQKHPSRAIFTFFTGKKYKICSGQFYEPVFLQCKMF